MISNKIIVVKFGGNALNESTLTEFSKQISEMLNQGLKPIVVHGGGPQISNMLEKSNVKSKFIDGLRYTDERAIKLVEMVLSGQVNKVFVDSLCKHNVEAVGVSGKDARTLVAKKADVDGKDLGLVGEITAVNTKLIESLLQSNFVPVISPIAISDKYETLNVNADFVASSVANAVAADCLVLITNTAGLKDASNKLIKEVNAKEVNKLILDGVIKDGMMPKIKAAIQALEKAKKVKIIDGRIQNSLVNCLKGVYIGTTITK